MKETHAELSMKHSSQNFYVRIYGWESTWSLLEAKFNDLFAVFPPHVQTFLVQYTKLPSEVNSGCSS